MRKVLVLAFIICLGCVTKPEEKDRLYLKEINIGNENIEWFYYSNVASTSADYVLLNDLLNDKKDTIVKSTNIKDINFLNDTIFLLFKGTPKIYDAPVFIKNKIKQFKISVDTTALSDGPQPSRKSYLKKE